MTERKKFRYLPGPSSLYAFIIFIPSTLAGVGLLLLILRDGGLFSSKGLMVTAFLGFATVYLSLVPIRYFKSPWAYIVNNDKLIAERLWGRDRVEIRWTDIVRIAKVPRSRPRTWPFIQVEAHDGRKILIGTHLIKYQDLVDIFRQRATNCREFDVYTSMTDKS